MSIDAKAIFGEVFGQPAVSKIIKETVIAQHPHNNRPVALIMYLDSTRKHLLAYRAKYLANDNEIKKNPFTLGMVLEIFRSQVKQ